MIGQQILNYKIEKLIGEGGMGNVYLGIHTHIGRKVAIKALNPALAKNPDIRERFKNEASTLSQLHHPNIVTLFDYVETDQGIFLVMEYVEGKQLDQYIETVTGPIPEEKAIPLFTQILDGVSYAHQRNVIHRDIKPSNIIITSEGKAKILDFGIAKILSESNHKLTKTGTKLGTVLFMSPEQVKGVEVDKRTDIYSLGITLFQTLTGKSPFDEDQSEYEVYKRIVEEPLPDAKTFYIGVSDRMELILKKATAKNVSERFNDCDEFKQALIDINFGHSTSKRNKTKPVKTIVARIPVKKPAAKVKTHKRKGWTIFWSIFFGMLFSTALVVTTYKLIFRGTEKYVLANKLWIRSSETLAGNNGVELLKFGEKLTVLETDSKLDVNGLRWAKVRLEDGKEGYTPIDYVGSEEEYEQINAVFKDNALKDTPVIYKKAVIDYLHSNGMIDKDNSSNWSINGNLLGTEFNNYIFADFNQDGKDDYACVVNNGDKYLLLVFVSGSVLDATLKIAETDNQKISIKKLPRGTKYFTGKYTTENRIDWYGEIYTVNVKVYDVLKSDAIVITGKQGNKSKVYTYDINHNDFILTALPQ